MVVRNLNGSRRFQGCLTVHELAIYTDNLPTKFEVSISTHYEDMKDDTKCRKLGGLGVVSFTQGHWKYHQSIEHLRVPILAFHNNYIPILHRL